MPARLLLAIILAATLLPAQVYSPRVVAKGQPDASSLQRLAQSIYANAGAHTPREKAEAIWRFFLTDGRYVAPGFWYHIAGWAYEEPAGEVLDPVKLLNSYGFGLCYHIAPLLEAVYEAGGFQDARVWFLTGHTVTEVFYDGAYHHYDSDMLGYSTTGNGPAATSPVASVVELEKDPSIILGKLTGRRTVDPIRASSPWYPADVQADAIPGLAEAFSTSEDNSLFPFQRTQQAHTMDFVLRPGERLIRYFEPESGSLYYLPYAWDGQKWSEFPREIKQYAIRTADGPRSQKDGRRWATGKIEYRPALPATPATVFEIRSPYVIIDAQFQASATLPAAKQTPAFETSTDDGRTWQQAAGAAPKPGQSAGGRVELISEPAVVAKTANGRKTAVSGFYSYLLRVTTPRGVNLEDLLITTRFQVNPRTLPALRPGPNELSYASGPTVVRRESSLDTASLAAQTHTASGARFESSAGQGYWVQTSAAPGEFVFRLAAPKGETLQSLDAGGRFLDLSRGLAPDKLTAEVRTVTPVPARKPAASIEWSLKPSGPFQPIWQYKPNPEWLDKAPVSRLLSWPEIDRRVPLSGAREVYIRYRFQDLALDNVRLAVESRAPAAASPLEITHTWKENGLTKSKIIQIPAGAPAESYTIDIPPSAAVQNEAVIFECKRR